MNDVRHSDVFFVAHRGLMCISPVMLELYRLIESHCLKLSRLPGVHRAKGFPPSDADVCNDVWPFGLGWFGVHVLSLRNSFVAYAVSPHYAQVRKGSIRAQISSLDFQRCHWFHGPPS